MRRAKMSRKSSRKVFKRGAKRVHSKNHVGAGNAMRGGIRL